MIWVKCSTQAELDAAIKAGNGAEVSAGYFGASDSATVRASGSATVRAYDSATVTASGSATVTASEFVAVHIFSKLAKVRGGIVIRPKFTATTPAKWCAEHHVKVVRGVATVYKAVRAGYKSSRGGDYSPGTTPVAADWDGGKAECGGGLHFSPHPLDALYFESEQKHYVACKVRLADMRTPKESDDYPHKIKARGCCGPCVECDKLGNIVEAK